MIITTKDAPNLCIILWLIEEQTHELFTDYSPKRHPYTYDETTHHYDLQSLEKAASTLSPRDLKIMATGTDEDIERVKSHYGTLDELDEFLTMYCL